MKLRRKKKDKIVSGITLHYHDKGTAEMIRDNEPKGKRMVLRYLEYFGRGYIRDQVMISNNIKLFRKIQLFINIDELKLSEVVKINEHSATALMLAQGMYINTLDGPLDLPNHFVNGVLTKIKYDISPIEGVNLDILK